MGRLLLHGLHVFLATFGSIESLGHLNRRHAR
jgi:hypothetical protein